MRAAILKMKRKVLLITIIVLFIAVVALAIVFLKQESEQTIQHIDPPKQDVSIESTISLKNIWLQKNKDKIQNIIFVNNYDGDAQDATVIGVFPAYLNQETVYICLGEQQPYVTDDCKECFKDWANLKNVDGMEKLNFSKVTNVDSMFENSGLQKLDLSSSNWHSVINANRTFYNCRNLEEITMPSDLASLKNTTYMFSECSQLKYVDFNGAVLNLNNASYMFNSVGWAFACNVVPNFKIQSVKNLSYFFSNTRFIDYQSLIDAIDVTYVEDVTGLFQGSQLYEIDLSSWKASNFKHIDYMFDGCSAMYSLKLGDWNVENLESAEAAFRSCTSLDTAPTFLGNAKKIKNIKQMFAYCYSLQSADVSYLDGANVLSADQMFFRCIHLENVYGDGFTAVSSHQMFEKCNFSNYDQGKINADMAQSDTGYFTKK